MIVEKIMPINSVLVCFTCKLCDHSNNNSRVAYFFTNGIHFMDWIITAGGPLVQHLCRYHKIHCIGELDDVEPLRISKYCVIASILLPCASSYTTLQAKEGFIWRNEEIENDLLEVLSSTGELKLLYGNGETMGNNDDARAAASLIALQKYDCVESITSLTVHNLHLGQEVLAVHTPFSSISLYNSWTKGSICNVISTGLALVDIRVTKTFEGAPVFLIDEGGKGPLAGLLICSLSYINNELTGYSFIAILSAIKSPVKMLKLCSEFASPRLSFPLDQYDQQSVVSVIAGKNLGSGTLISNDGLLLTCSHLIEFGDNPCGDINVKVGGTSRIAQVLFCTQRGMSCELAILKIPISIKETFKPIPMSTRTLVLGEEVYAIGFSLFSRKRPIGTKGIISKISSHFIVTTCMVHEGSSGGALLDAGGNLIGIIIYNVRGDHIYPFVNVSIPCKEFGSTLENFINNRDITPLTEWSNRVPRDAANLQFDCIIRYNEVCLKSKI